MPDGYWRDQKLKEVKNLIERQADCGWKLTTNQQLLCKAIRCKSILY